MPAPRRRRAVPLLALLLFGAACGRDGADSLTPYLPPETAEPELPSTSILPVALDPVLTARLSQRWESEHFIFHFEPSDDTCCEAMRMEAFHKWAVSYLNITMPKKIDYYKFPTVGELERAYGRRPNGVAFPEVAALATWLPWHNHEAFHIYLYFFRGEKRTTRFFDEGMVVAHEFDPLNHDWVPRQTRREPHHTHLERVLEYRANADLSPIEELMESEAFNQAMERESPLICYSQAGIFVTYLLHRFGLEKLREVMVAVDYADSLPLIRINFQRVFGVSLQEAEGDWLAWLDGMLP